MFMVEVVTQPQPHPGLWSTAGVFPGTYSLAAGMATSGALTGWLRNIAGNPPYEMLVEEAAKVRPGSDGLLVLPYFAGERTPLFDPQARGIIAGLTLSHGRGHLYRALLEATAYGVRHILETMREAGGGSKRLVAVGGGTKGGLWTQIVSSVVGREQVLPAETIGASYGDALLAAIAGRFVPEGTRWDNAAAVIEPDAATRDTYERLYALYRDLYPATRTIAHSLADMQMGDS
jgi:xylulokinase